MPDISKLAVLYVEDEPELREHVGFALRLHIENIITAANGQEALEMIRVAKPDIVISDIRMPVMDGLELTAILRRKYPALPVLLCTAFTDTTYLLKAIELGVAAYIPKPIDTERLLAAVRQAALPILQQREIQRLKAGAIQACGIMTEADPAMQELAEQISQVADSEYAVVIRGESGTGKSTVAELLHSMSGRSRKPLLTLDCRSRSSEQLEEELFGRLTGRGRPTTGRDSGLLREIHGGTLVLDAPELLSLPLQARILGLLEKRTYLPTGSPEVVCCDLRVLTLTSVNLTQESAAGRFNQNLLLRLSDSVLPIPPLRERAETLPAYCRTLLAQAADELGRPCPVFSSEAMKLLQQERWPGNFRQLKQFIRRAAFRCNKLIEATDIKNLLDQPSAPPVKAPEDLPSYRLTDIEAWAIRRALNATDGKKMQAAELLGISYNAFKEKLKRYSNQQPFVVRVAIPEK